MHKYTTITQLNRYGVEK